MYSPWINVISISVTVTHFNNDRHFVPTSNILICMNLFVFMDWIRFVFVDLLKPIDHKVHKYKKVGMRVNKIANDYLFPKHGFHYYFFH